MGSWGALYLFLQTGRQCKFFKSYRPFAAYSHMVQNRHVGTQETHWDKTNKEKYHFKWCKFFVCLVQVHLLRPNMAVFAPCDYKLQRAYCCLFCTIWRHQKQIVRPDENRQTDERPIQDWQNTHWWDTASRTSLWTRRLTVICFALLRNADAKPTK